MRDEDYSWIPSHIPLHVITDPYIPPASAAEREKDNNYPEFTFHPNPLQEVFPEILYEVKRTETQAKHYHTKPNIIYFTKGISPSVTPESGYRKLSLYEVMWFGDWTIRPYTAKPTALIRL
jgi:hypothetical protein